jgi:hypothetical protein
MDFLKGLRQHQALAASGDNIGYLNGRPYTSYVEDVKQLKRVGDVEGAERLLLALIDVIETEARVKKWGVAPWYYEELAKLYRQRRDYRAEVAILQRFAKQPHAPGVMPQQLLERLDKAKALLAESERA